MSKVERQKHTGRLPLLPLRGLAYRPHIGWVLPRLLSGIIRVPSAVLIYHVKSS